MLQRLLIEDYGLIQRAEIAFSDGATLFTGETGSGKTMLLGALGFVLGERATTDSVGRGATRASVSLTFEANVLLRARFDADGFTLDEGERGIISREITVAGKSALRLNGKPATASYVREIAGDIADMVGQHDAQRLLSPPYHVELLDRFAGGNIASVREQVQSAFDELTRIDERLAEIEGDDRRARAVYEEARFAAEEIEAARLTQGEDEPLRERQRILDNAERIAEALRIAHDALSGDSGFARGEDLGASAALGSASTALHGIAGIAPTLSQLSERARSLQAEATDLAAEVAREADAAEFNPNELEEINARLGMLERLQRKYGGTLDAVIAFGERARQTAADFDGRDERIVKLRACREQQRTELAQRASALAELRHAAAAKLSAAIRKEFTDLALVSGRFEVTFEELLSIGRDGAEAIEFAFAANAGEPLRPLARVASGGELSRVLLALVVVSAKSTGAAFIFDEIDTGIGGATASAVAARIDRLAKKNQVVCVTHLAQIASRAKRHYVLEKTERGKTTTISVRELETEAEREAELARMLSGETHEIALQHARKLLHGV